MKKSAFLSIAGVVLLFCAIAQVAAGDVILQVPSTSSNPVWTPFSLNAGQPYQIEASGTYIYNGAHSFPADAAWVYDHLGNWVEELSDYPPGTCHLFVNGQEQSWLGTTDGQNFFADTYSPSHIYRLNIVGTGSPISFYISDTDYSDNSGSLQVDVTPEPATLLFLGLGAMILRRKG